MIGVLEGVGAVLKQVKRTMVWMAGYRPLQRRYDHKVEHFLVFYGVACTLISVCSITR